MRSENEIKIRTISALKVEVGQILNTMGYTVDFDKCYGGLTFELVAERKKENSWVKEILLIKATIYRIRKPNVMAFLRNIKSAFANVAQFKDCMFVIICGSYTSPAMQAAKKVEFDFLLTTAEQLAKKFKIIEKEKRGDLQRVTSNK
jgi:hypothetical protein